MFHTYHGFENVSPKYSKNLHYFLTHSDLSARDASVTFLIHSEKIFMILFTTVFCNIPFRKDSVWHTNLNYCNSSKIKIKILVFIVTHSPERTTFVYYLFCDEKILIHKTKWKLITGITLWPALRAKTSILYHLHFSGYRVNQINTWK